MSCTLTRWIQIFVMHGIVFDRRRNTTRSRSRTPNGSKRPRRSSSSSDTSSEGPRRHQPYSHAHDMEHRRSISTTPKNSRWPIKVIHCIIKMKRRLSIYFRLKLMKCFVEWILAVIMLILFCSKGWKCVRLLQISLLLSPATTNLSRDIETICPPCGGYRWLHLLVIDCFLYFTLYCIGFVWYSLVLVCVA